MSEGAKRRALDSAGFSSAGATNDGRVFLDLWTEDLTAADDPARFSMSPGQALALIQKLAFAAQAALKGTVA